MDGRQVDARRLRGLEPGQVCVDDLGVALQAEDQRHVDADAGADGLGDGRKPRLGRGDLDEQVGAVDLGPQLLGLRDGTRGVMREVGGDLDRDAAVDVVGGLPHGAEHVEGCGDVLRGGSEDRFLRGGTGAGELGDLRVVRRVVLVGDRVGEDRRVRGDTDDILRVDEVLQVAGGDAGAGEVVEPDADACGGELRGGGAHAFSLVLLAAMVSRAAAMTASVVMPNFSKRVL